MTTIRSFDGETLLHVDPESAGGHWVRAQREGESGWIGDSYRRADLLAALDATANTDVKHRADAYEAATRAEDEAAKLRKELSESRKDTRNAELFSETWKARADAAEAELQELQNSPWKARCQEARTAAREWCARAEKAEAALVKIIEWWDSDEEDGALGDILRPLRPKPAFTLPTEAGVRFEARYDGNDRMDTFQSIAYTDPEGGPIALYLREANLVALTAKEVMSDFTAHRLLGADQ